MANNWVNQLTNQLNVYAEECATEVLEAANEVSQYGMRRLEIVSPKRTGKYSKNWRVKRFGSKFVVHNVKTYRLTHLLEKGHVNRDGSRTVAQPHIRKVEQEMIRKFIEQTEDRIERL